MGTPKEKRAVSQSSVKSCEKILSIWLAMQTPNGSG